MFRTTTLLAIAQAVSLCQARPPFAPASQNWPDRSREHHGDSANADYVVVGGGPAGLVVAESLSRDPGTSVVVLEAGPDGTDEPLINIPAYAPQLTNPTPAQYIWNYSSQPDPNLNGLSPSLAQGRVLGGGSAVNYMVYCRGAPSVFDEWAEISGDSGLRWENLFIDYLATVHLTEQTLDYVSDLNSSAYGPGPLEVTAPDDPLGIDLQWVAAVTEGLGLPEDDLNDGSALGVTNGCHTIRASNRTRDYALPAFGWQMADRPNVQILHGAWVSRIGFSENRATNVSYLSTMDNTTHTISAKEIIVAAGAINSPKLLMLSGVGPKEHLDALSIPLVADMTDVGANLRDHHTSVLEYEVTQSVETTWQFTQNTTFAAIAQEEYARNSSGPLGMSGGSTWAVVRAPDEVFADVNSSFHTSLPSDRGQLLFQLSTGSLLGPGQNVSTMSPFVSLVQPEASGHIRLQSADFRDDPLIYSDYYGSESDKAAVLWGYKKYRDILTNSSQLAPLIVKEVFPGANVTSDEDLWQAIQQSASSFHHPLGSVALGKVLDAGWRIKGLEGIRVVDSSTFPVPPTCHPQAAVYAYAHHVAEVIKRQDQK